MKYVIGGLLLAASVMLASTSATQAQSSMWPWNWGMAECKAGYKYDSAKNVCRAEKKKKKMARKSGKKKKA